MGDLRDAVRGVVDASELEQIAYLQLASIRKEPDAHTPGADEAQEDEFGFALKLAQNDDNDQLIVRLRTDVDSLFHETTVEVGAIYALDPPREIPEDVRLEFANLVGIMALLPFMREAVADMTRKVVGHPVIMPMIKTGDIRFEGDADS